MVNLKKRFDTLNAYNAFSSHYREYSSTRKMYIDAVDNLVITNLKKKVRY